jgi:hypothetical protein
MPYLIRCSARGVTVMKETKVPLKALQPYTVTLFWFHSANIPIQRRAFTNLLPVRRHLYEEYVRIQVVALVRSGAKAVMNL